mmetsp:Transcript_3320/g.9540  ORF Transcript_3320/g.9540 Transcript_3320/m.9540 type:complete len:329 (+) Transcript_3320:3534-4520(+)
MAPGTQDAAVEMPRHLLCALRQVGDVGHQNPASVDHFQRAEAYSDVDCATGLHHAALRPHLIDGVDVGLPVQRVDLPLEVHLCGTRVLQGEREGARLEHHGRPEVDVPKVALWLCHVSDSKQTERDALPSSIHPRALGLGGHNSDGPVLRLLWRGLPRRCALLVLLGVFLVLAALPGAALAGAVAGFAGLAGHLHNHHAVVPVHRLARVCNGGDLHGELVVLVGERDIRLKGDCNVFALPGVQVAVGRADGDACKALGPLEVVVALAVVAQREGDTPGGPEGPVWEVELVLVIAWQPVVQDVLHVRLAGERHLVVLEGVLLHLDAQGM